MKNKTIEIILTSKDVIPVWRQRQLADWLANTLQHVIRRQQMLTKKMTLSSMKTSPPIHLS